MMVSLGHPQTHVGERGEPSKFEKKFVQDSCTVYMILVHKPLTADGVTRPRHHRATTSRHNTATLHAVERALRGTTDADGDSSGVT